MLNSENNVSQASLIMRALISAVFFGALSACATTAIPTSQATPTSDVLDVPRTLQRDGTGKVSVKRDVGSVGSACAIRVLVDGKPLANLRQGQVVTAYLDPGDYILGASSTGICGGGDAESALSLRVGEKKTYRISIDQGASIRIGPTAQ